MLKNIVFDLGNVLVKFDSNELIYSFFNERQEEVKSFPSLEVCTMNV